MAQSMLKNTKLYTIFKIMTECPVLYSRHGKKRKKEKKITRYSLMIRVLILLLRSSLNDSLKKVLKKVYVVHVVLSIDIIWREIDEPTLKTTLFSFNNKKKKKQTNKWYKTAIGTASEFWTSKPPTSVM